MNGCLNRCYVRHIVFGTFSTRHDQWWTDEAHQRAVVLAEGGDGIQKIRVMLPDPAINDAKDFLWRLHVSATDHVSQEGIIASKELLCKVNGIVISHLDRLMNGLHNVTLHPFGTSNSTTPSEQTLPASSSKGEVAIESPAQSYTIENNLFC